MAMTCKAFLGVAVLVACLGLGVGSASGADAPQPGGAKVVYKSDFAKGAGQEWWPRRTDATPAGNRAFLGQFGVEPATLALHDLPPHKFLRIKISLFMLETMDGTSAGFGVCPWEMRVLDGGPRLIYATFDNCCFFSDNNEQSFPDEFPYAVHKGWTGATERQTLGFVRPFHDGAQPEDCSSVYDMTLVFPHEDKSLRLLLHAVWGKTQKKWGAAWGLENMTVEALDGPVPVAEKELENLWADLAGQDAGQAFLAVWKLAGAGDQAVEFIAKKIGKPIQARQPDPAAAPEDEVGRLLKELDNPSFQVRETATRRLAGIGRPALARLQEVARTSESPEVRFRLQEIIKKLQAQPDPQAEPKAAPKDLLPQRAVRVLETIGGPKALGVLAGLADGEDAKFAAFAQGARQRLAERMIDHDLALADAAARADDAKTTEALCGEAAKLAKACAPEESGRIGATLNDCRSRAKARAADVNVVGADARREAMRQRLAVGDDPAGAAKLADDPKDREALALAARPIEDLMDDQVATLRAFYLKAAKGADGKVLPGMVARALSAARPDAKATEEGFDPTKGMPKDFLKAWMIDQALHHGRWTDLVPLIDIPAIDKGNHVVPENAWRMQWNGPKCGGSTPYLCLPVQLDGSYQLRMTVMVCRSKYTVWVPVGDRHVAFHMDWTGKIFRETGDVGPAGPASWAALSGMSVDEVQVEATVRRNADGTAAVSLRFDGRDVGVDWKGKVADLQKGAPGTPPPGCPGIRMEGNWGLVRQAAVRMLDDQGKVAFDAVKQPEEAAPPVAVPVAPDGDAPIEIELDFDG
jgi:hypothetical protein